MGPACAFASLCLPPHASLFPLQQQTLLCIFFPVLSWRRRSLGIGTRPRACLRCYACSRTHISFHCSSMLRFAFFHSCLPVRSGPYGVYVMIKAPIFHFPCQYPSHLTCHQYPSHLTCTLTCLPQFTRRPNLSHRIYLSLHHRPCP